jgi:hypothetical protein
MKTFKVAGCEIEIPDYRYGSNPIIDQLPTPEQRQEAWEKQQISSFKRKLRKEVRKDLYAKPKDLIIEWWNPLSGQKELADVVTHVNHMITLKALSGDLKASEQFHKFIVHQGIEKHDVATTERSSVTREQLDLLKAKGVLTQYQYDRLVETYGSRLDSQSEEIVEEGNYIDTVDYFEHTDPKLALMQRKFDEDMKGVKKEIDLENASIDDLIG